MHDGVYTKMYTQSNVQVHMEEITHQGKRQTRRGGIRKRISNGDKHTWRGVHTEGNTYGERCIQRGVLVNARGDT